MPPPPTFTVFLLVGAVLVIVGVVQLARHGRGGQFPGASESGQSEEELDFFAGQHHRRTSTAILLILLGVLVPLGRFTFIQQAPVERFLRGTYWLGMLALVVGLLIISIIDLAKTGMRTRRALRRVRAEQAQLEQAIARKSRLR